MGRPSKDKYRDYEFSRRKVTLNVNMESAITQALVEGRKLLPLSECYQRMSDDDKRRYTEAIIAMIHWSREMHRLANLTDDDSDNDGMGTDTSPDAQKQP